MTRDGLTAPSNVGLRQLIPGVLGVLVRRGADFATAEDAVQEALISAFQTWPGDPPRDPKGWLVTTAWRKFLDLVRADTARQGREESLAPSRRPGRPRMSTTPSSSTCAVPTLR